MVENGWQFNFNYDGTNPSDSNYQLVGRSCVGAKWYGWSHFSQVGTLSAILQGSGEVSLGFGNCWDDGSVNVYLDGALKSTAKAGIKNQAVKFEFTPGSVLSIKDENGNAVIRLNSITFSCTGMLISNHIHISTDTSS